MSVFSVPMRAVLTRLRHDDGSHARILRSLFVVGLFVLGGKLAAAAREMAVAWRYGIGDVVDAYLFSFTLVTWLPGVWVSVLVATYVPLVNRLPDERRARFRSELHTLTWCGALALTALIYIGLPPLLPMLAGDVTAHARSIMVDVTRGLAPLAGLGLLVGLYSSMLLAIERHANTLLEAVPALVVLAAVLLWGGGGAAWPLVGGAVLGTALQLLVLRRLLGRDAAAPGIVVTFESPVWTAFRRAIGLLALSQVVVSLSLPIDQMLAARLDEGSLSTLGFANRVLALGLGLGATAVGRAILPVLSDAALDDAARRAIAVRWFFVMLGVGFVTVALGWWLAEPAVALLYERGAFDGDDTRRVASVVRFGLLQVPLFFAGMVVVQLFASLGRYPLIVISGLIAITVKLATGPWLTSRFGVEGVVLSTAATYAASSSYLFWHLVRGGSATRGDGQPTDEDGKSRTDAPEND